MSITPCYLSKQTHSCLPWSCRAMSYALQHHCLAALQGHLRALLCHSELYMRGLLHLTVINSLSLSSPQLYPTFIFCLMLGLGCNLIRARIIFFFFIVCIMCVTQGSWSKDRALKCYGNINNFVSLHKVMSMSICSSASYLHAECSLSEHCTPTSPPFL